MICNSCTNLTKTDSPKLKLHSILHIYTPSNLNILLYKTSLFKRKIALNLEPESLSFFKKV